MEFGGEEDYLANMTVPAKMENNSDDAAQDAVRLDFLSVKNCLDFLLIVRVTCIARRVGVSRAMGACVPGGVPLVPARALPSTRRL
uniref:Uncharacterized protein n=1 Tax=Timema douglasi TaxID=61478 RepID=A0A7R8Z560_TIMDO|nr:unnamed protein product [Timema douglasi]